jgi:ankyrin repeat protein
MGEDNLEVITFLVERGADVNAHDNHGTTPLIYACRDGGNLEIIKFLVERGADVNARAEDGYTPLIHIYFRSAKVPFRQMCGARRKCGERIPTKSGRHPKVPPTECRN